MCGYGNNWATGVCRHWRTDMKIDRLFLSSPSLCLFPSSHHKDMYIQSGLVRDCMQHVKKYADDRCIVANGSTNT